METDPAHPSSRLAFWSLCASPFTKGACGFSVKQIFNLWLYSRPQNAIARESRLPNGTDAQAKGHCGRSNGPRPKDRSRSAPPTSREIERTGRAQPRHQVPAGKAPHCFLSCHKPAAPGFRHNRPRAGRSGRKPPAPCPPYPPEGPLDRQKDRHTPSRARMSAGAW